MCCCIYCILTILSFLFRISKFERQLKSICKNSNRMLSCINVLFLFSVPSKVPVLPLDETDHFCIAMLSHSSSPSSRWVDLAIIFKWSSLSLSLSLSSSLSSSFQYFIFHVALNWMHKV